MNKSVLKKAAILTEYASLMGDRNCKTCGGTGVYPFTMDDFCDCVAARKNHNHNSRKELRQIDDPWKPSIEVDNSGVESGEALDLERYKDEYMENVGKSNEYLND